MLNILAVFLGGGIGAACRYLITMISNRFFGIAHWGTFSANIIGCFLIGYIFGYTLSTFSCESFCFLRDGKILHCALYMLASFAIGLCATFAGFMLAK